MSRSARLRLTAAAALATSLTALSLTRVVAGADTVPRWLGAVLIVAAAGAGCRASAVPRAMIPALQLTALGLYLTALFAGSSALLHLLPTPEAVEELGRLAASGMTEINRSTAPAPTTAGILLISTAAVGAVAVLVEAAVTFSRAALAGLPLLLLYSVPAAILPAGLPWPLFVLATVGYLTLLGSEGRERRGRQAGARAGRGPLPSAPGPAAGARTSARHGRRARPPGDGTLRARLRSAFTGRTGTGLGISAVSLALLIPLALPDLGGGLVGRLRGRTTGAADQAGGSGVITVVNPIVSLKRDLNQGRPIPLLVTRTSGDSATDGQYLRLVTLDQFDGEQWTPSERPVTALPDALPPPEGLTDAVPRRTVRTDIAVTRNLAGAWLPLPYPALRVDVKGRWRFEASGRSIVGAQGQTTADLTYSVTSVVPEPTAAQLASTAPPPAQLAGYTRLPDRLPPSVARTAAQIVGDAATPFEKARRLQAWFTDGNNFRYDTSVAPGNGLSAIESFLRDRRGYCEQFAATMAAMARTLAIPARVNVGFTPGTPRADGARLVDSHDAHAWPELYFTGIGWLRFEPTPTTDTGVLGTEPAHTTTTTRQAAPSGSAQVPATPVAPARPAGCAAGRGDPFCTAGPGADPRSSTRTTGRLLPGTALWAGLGITVLAVVLAPMLIRRQTRRRRLAPGPGSRAAASARRTVAGAISVPRRFRPRASADPRARALAAWDELRDCVIDLGYGWHPAETPRQITGRLAREGRLAPTTAAALDRLAQAAEKARYAATPPEGTVGLADDLRAVHAGLAAHTARTVRVRALLLPRSTLGGLYTTAARTARETRRVRSRHG